MTTLSPHPTTYQAQKLDLSRMTKEEFVALLAGAIRGHPKVHQALLDWICSNPYIDCTE